MIAITVSTNYIDLLPIVYHTNKSLFKKWIFVTSKNDLETIKFLADKPDVVTLFWDFQNERRIFDKGGAIRHAQYYAYENFPDEWYLIIDSDILLPAIVHSNLLTHVEKASLSIHKNREFIFGLDARIDFKKLSDFYKRVNFEYYEHTKGVFGYFQLYRTPYFYSQSRDASNCDYEFSLNFKECFFISEKQVYCVHLGVHSTNWKGDRRPGSDFIIDTDIKFE